MVKLCVVILFMVEAQANWFNEKHSHRPQPLDVMAEELQLLVFTNSSKNTSFEYVLDPMLISRVPGTANNKIVREYIRRHMSDLGWMIEADAFTDNTPNGPVDFENIIATLNPQIHRLLVLACHYDSKIFEEINFVGATDSAVPCAMMLHLAYALKDLLNAQKQMTGQKVTLQFIFFDGEEAFKSWTDVDSLYGSRHLAAFWQGIPYPPGNSDNTNYLSRIDLFVLLDLIGVANPSFVNYFEETTQWYNDIIKIESALRKYSMWNGNLEGHEYFQSRRSNGEIQDDHIPFIRRKVHALHIIATPFPSVWHTPKDNKAALDFPSIDNLNRILRVFVGRYLHFFPDRNQISRGSLQFLNHSTFHTLIVSSIGILSQRWWLL